MRHIGRCLFCNGGERKIEESWPVTFKDNGGTRKYRMYKMTCSCGAYGSSAPNRTAAIKLWNEGTQFLGSKVRWHETIEEES